MHADRVVVDGFAVDLFQDQASELVCSRLELDLPGLRLSDPDVLEVEDDLFEVSVATHFTVCEACDEQLVRSPAFVLTVGVVFLVYRFDSDVPGGIHLGRRLYCEVRQAHRDSRLGGVAAAIATAQPNDGPE
jgi:hypothetical protein